ncbi:exonuclease 1 [Pelodytes ibericus]
MGIQGLLQFLKDASEPVHIKKYRGQTVAVDTYCWLHKGAFACAEKLAKGEPTDQYVSYCMKFVHMLLLNDVRPILVFDGCTLPSKKDVEKARREKRQVNLQRGKQLLREGKLSEARDCFSRSINITSSMAHDVIKAARAEGIECIVAPYEADSQLTYLNKVGSAQAIITEDSDLLAFGCKKVILKMDKFGNGLEIDQERLGMCKHLGDVFTEEKFRYMCILSGCDYLPSIHGIGLAKASKLLKIANNPDIITVIKKIGQYLKTNITVPDGYIEGFVRANNTFLYQLVFDPVNKKLVPLNPYEADVNPEDLSYAGPNFGDATALQVALGNVDIHTMEQIDDYNPNDPQPSQRRSHSWCRKGSSQTSSQSDGIWQRNSAPSANVAADRGKMEDKASPVPRGLIFPNNKKTAKRPPEGRVSDSDLFSQYSFAKSKKPKKEPDSLLTQLKNSSPEKILQPRDDGSNNKAVSPQPRIRNTFTAALHRRNEKCGSISVAGTRSRFFCKPSDLLNSLQTEKVQSDVSDPLREGNHKTETVKEELDESVEKEPSEDSRPQDVPASPLAGSRGGCFSWSGSLSASGSKPPAASPSLLSLQKFHRSKPCVETGAENGTMGLTNIWQENTDRSPSTNPFRIQSSPTGPEKTSGPVESGDSSTEELDSSLESPSQITVKTPPAFPERKVVICNGKVPGLSKPKSTLYAQGKKVKPTAPAKASGLSSRGLKKPTHNNENTPGLQVTINDLWKNFSFKK